MKKTVRVVAAVSSVALALAVAGCGSSRDNKTATSTPTATNTVPKESHPGVTACQVSDSGGFDDKGFNQNSHDGLVNAAKDLGVKTHQVESNSDTEYADNINEMINQGCNIVTTVGFLLGDATLAAAKANPKVDFAIVDYAYDKAPANLKGLTFDTAQPSFLAGYLAAGTTKSGVVGTFGGLQIPTVTSFMDGFYNGVQKYNADSGKSIKVIGWNPTTQKGSFVGGFDDKNKGSSIANEMISQGADIIMPVAGPAGLGGLAAAQDKGIKAIWVDTDGCVSASEYCDVLLTSVMKRMDVAVEESIKESANKQFDNTLYNGTLANGGVDLAPYHNNDSAIPQELKDKITQLKADIISGKQKVS